MNAENKGKHQPERGYPRREQYQKVMLHATYSATSLSLNVDVLDADYVRGNSEDVQADVQAFLLEACKRASNMGVPCQIET